MSTSRAERTWLRAALIGWLSAAVLGPVIAYGFQAPMVAYFTMLTCLMPSGVWAIWYWGKK